MWRQNASTPCFWLKNWVCFEQKCKSDEKVADGAQCHPLDGTGNCVGTGPEKGVDLSFDNRLLAS